MKCDPENIATIFHENHFNVCFEIIEMPKHCFGSHDRLLFLSFLNFEFASKRPRPFYTSKRSGWTQNTYNKTVSRPCNRYWQKIVKNYSPLLSYFYSSFDRPRLSRCPLIYDAKFQFIQKRRDMQYW